MVFGVLGSILLYTLFAVGLGASVGEQVGKALGKNPRLFAGVGAGIGLLALAAFFLVSHHRRPAPPPPYRAPVSPSPSVVVDPGSESTPGSDADSTVADTTVADASESQFVRTASLDDDASEGESSTPAALDAPVVIRRGPRRGGLSAVLGQ